jgi:P27 family predicted phage terminase small subunit
MKIPRAPKHLPPEAREVWKETVAELQERGLFGPARAPLVASYCFSVAKLREAEAALQAAGQDATKAVYDRLNMHHRHVLEGARAIGLSATSQIRSRPEQPPADAADADAADDWHRAANRALGLLQ